MPPRARNWCFTYNYTENEQNGNIPFEPSTFVPSSDRVRYGIWQLESAPETGRHHLQGYIEFDRPIRMGGVKTLLGSTRVHLEPRAGPRDVCIDYCRKLDSRLSGPWTLGDENSNQGKRNDLLELAVRIKAGEGIFSIADSDPVNYIRYRRGLESLHALYSERAIPIWRDVSVLVYYGEAGTGKTRKAIEDSKDDFFILDQGDRLWFDGYRGQGTLILDDFYGWIKYGTLLRILDGHPFRCEIKGSFAMANWTRVVITSNKPPAQWYGQGLTPALSRRITEVECLTL